jgi:hypothetical protein
VGKGATVVAALAAAVSTTVGAAPARTIAAGPIVERVIFQGTPIDPQIRITGRRLTSSYVSSSPPQPDPPYPPGSHPLCRLDLTGEQGYDYGTEFYFVDWSAHPRWIAGRYRPFLGELDCIGIVITRWTARAIEFHFGSGYRQGHYPRIVNKNIVQLFLNHIPKAVVVKYGRQGVRPIS